MENKILLGFEVGTGEKVCMSLAHTVVTGMTQLSGKTTTLEAIINRSGLTAIAFKTKRGESGFNSYHEVPPFFRERGDWRYIQSLLEATMRERMKFERSWIIKASKGAELHDHPLKEVYANVQELKKKARPDSLSESVYTVLEEYMKIVIPQIEKFTFSKTLTLENGINVMDLTAMSLEMRSLVIRSVMEYVADELSNVIVIVPEAWEYIPQGRSTPVKQYAESFARKGASVGNYLFVDSQDVAGIDKTPLRSCNNWIMGRQKEEHEVNRVREIIGKKISEDEIRKLSLGEFYASLGDDLKKVYVLPVGVPEEMGIQVARGEISSEVVKEELKSRSKVGEDEMFKELYEKEKKRTESLENDVKDLKGMADEQANALKKLQSQSIDWEGERAGYSQQAEAIDLLEGNVKKLIGELAECKKKLEEAEKTNNAVSKLREGLLEIIGPMRSGDAQDQQSSELNIRHDITVMNVITAQKVMEVNTSNVLGRVALLYSEGFFDEREKPISDINKELVSRGWPKDPRISDFLSDICSWGFLKKWKTDRWLYIAAIKSTEAREKGLLKNTVEEGK